VRGREVIPRRAQLALALLLCRVEQWAAVDGDVSLLAVRHAHFHHAQLYSIQQEKGTTSRRLRVPQLAAPAQTIPEVKNLDKTANPIKTRLLKLVSKRRNLVTLIVLIVSSVLA